MIYKTLNRKLKIEEHEHHSKPGMNSCAPEGLALMHCIVIVSLNSHKPGRHIVGKHSLIPLGR